MIPNVNLASAGIQFLQLTKSLKEINRLNEMFTEESTKLSEKMLRLNVEQKVQSQQVKGRIDLFA
jgi:hypothetical protein